MSLRLCLSLCPVLASLLVAGPVRGDERPDPRAVEFFESRVRPLLAENCVSCHGPEKQRGGLRLDVAGGVGRDGGPVVVPGQPEKSPLIAAVRQTGEIKMPPKGKLSDEAVEVLAAWVRMGAPRPEVAAAAPNSVAEARQKHWAFRPVRKVPPPAVKDADWGVDPIDRFVLARLEEKGLSPSPPADARTLVRRVTFDLIGLPPTPEEVEAFVSASGAKPQAAYEELVERLLASPRYGERWARHWLDVARYADTKGYVFQEERRFAGAYAYRDYVTRAFNDDLPYDQFVLQQLAADRLDLGDDRRPLAAMGFLTLGRRFLNNQQDIIDDRIDVACRGLLGLTVTCARCHDHKFDPVPSKDYYSLYGVFAASTEPKELPEIGAPPDSPQAKDYAEKLKPLQEEVKRYEEEHAEELKANNRKARDELRARKQKVDQLKATHPGAPMMAQVLTDLPQPPPARVLLRGNPANPGPEVPRQFLEVLAGPDRKPFADGSGRLELAKAIADGNNPLTARVIVNRIWAWHFGEGLVRTPSDFGSRGEPPTHPELLDWLAATFVEDGWSLKKLHRRIVLSRTYRQRSDNDPRGLALDPDNRLLWKFNRQRLDFEQLRDALLAVAGRLDARMGGPAVEITTAPFSTRRTLYGFVDRQNLPGLFRTFDFASPDTTSPRRLETTVPQQALFLLNSPFVVEQARALAARPDLAGAASPEERVRRLYRLLFGREADAEEVALGVRFVTAAKAEGKLSPWEKYAQVLLLSNEFATVD